MDVSSPALASSPCTLCPRNCRVRRSEGRIGFCGADNAIRIARAALHRFEEPCISGTRGSGAIFFSGCNLRCVYCQNYALSHDCLGFPVSDEDLITRILALRDAGAHSLNLVTPTPYADRLAAILRALKPDLGIPVVWNCGGYESLETLALLEGLVDVYLPDFKYADPALAASLSAAPDYPEAAAAAIAAMAAQTGRPVFDGDGMLTRGTLIRHLVLPGHRANSIAVLDRLAELFPDRSAVRLSLMSQYTPEFYERYAPEQNPSGRPDPLRRRVTTFEYESVLSHAADLGFEGYRQDRASATAAYTPTFFSSAEEEASASEEALSPQPQAPSQEQDC